jgi:hypothetical protein
MRYTDHKQGKIGGIGHPCFGGVAEFTVDLLKLRVSKKTVSPYEMSKV